MGKVYNLAPRMEFEPLPTGDYMFTLIGQGEVTEDRDSQFHKRGDVRLELIWQVEVPGSEPEERREKITIPETFSRKAKFVIIAVALGLADDKQGAAEGAAIDFEQGIGRSCTVSVIRKRKEDGSGWTERYESYSMLANQPARRRRPTFPGSSQPVKPIDNTGIDGEDVPF